MRNFDAYRFSTSWARVLPEGRGQVNQEGLDFYDRLVDAILARNLNPFLTLYHWDLPETLAELGGWTNRDIAHWFGDFTEIVMDRIGDRVASVATINEPWCVSYLSHFLGYHAPGLRDIGATASAVHHVLLAHGEAVQRLRAQATKNIGIVLNFEALKPKSDSAQDKAATATWDAVMNRLFIEPLMTGTYPAVVLDGFADHMPVNWQDDMSVISQPLDWLGVNYYTRQIVSAAPSQPWPSTQLSSSNSTRKTQMDWEIYPEGLGSVLAWLAEEFIDDLPMFVTENGMAWDDQIIDGEVNDADRVLFIADHLQEIHKAISNGIEVQGYFYWSLLDNFEWAYGYQKRFGLVHVDRESQKRTPKRSFKTLDHAIARLP